MEDARCKGWTTGSINYVEKVPYRTERFGVKDL